MKFSLAGTAAILALGAQLTSALPNPSAASIVPVLEPRGGPDWKCNGSWGDGILVRLSFLFEGYCEDRWGQCFLDSLHRKALLVHNWQAWQRDDGWWQVDFSTTAGIAWQANNAIEEITGTWRGCWPNE